MSDITRMTGLNIAYSLFCHYEAVVVRFTLINPVSATASNPCEIKNQNFFKVLDVINQFD